MAALAPHATFARRYKILSVLGSGGMGHVYRAEHVALGKPVALKVLGASREEHAGRIEREAQAIARLDHPGCVRVLDHGCDEHGTPYLVMELLEGGTLAELVRDERVPVARAVRLAGQILAALAHAHRHGVIHRDLKPDNIIIRERDGRPVLIDFGLALVHGAPALTGSGLAVGSPSYMAPERLYGQPYDARADLYAVGVLLFELISGARPFGGASPEEIMANAMTRPPRPLRALAPGVPAPLEAVIVRALAKDPARRFADAEDMRSALDAAMEISAELDEPDPSASITIAELVLARPSWAGRLWGWLRYGAWRWS